jgi:hypothetical protein
MQLNIARDKWQEATNKAAQGFGRPRDSTVAEATASADFRIRGASVLLTYQGLAGPHLWHEFLDFLTSNLADWKVKYWTATFEDNASSDTCHAHVMFQFNSQQDRVTRAFAFRGIRPNASTADLLGEGICRKKVQQSVDRGHFYVWADKLGTLQNPATGDLCVAGNYEPSWTDARCKYRVQGAWPERLWKSHKLSHARYEEYLFACRDGVISRKRNLDACRSREEQVAAQAELDARAKRIRSAPGLFKPFPEIPEATSWKGRFAQDALRYPILVVLGPSRSGKTEWAKTLFSNPLELKVGTLAHFPDGMRAFDRKRHDGIILDDVRDLSFLADHQEKLQGKYDALVEFASTQGGTCAYTKDLFQIPIVATINYSTLNLGYLDSHDWLGHPDNRVLVTFAGPLHG